MKLQALPLSVVHQRDVHLESEALNWQFFSHALRDVLNKTPCSNLQDGTLLVTIDVDLHNKGLKACKQGTQRATYRAPFCHVELCLLRLTSKRKIVVSNPTMG